MSRLRNDKMREKVNALRARGLSYWDISQRLHIQPSMVRYYANNIIEKKRKKARDRKFGVSNITINIDENGENIG